MAKEICAICSVPVSLKGHTDPFCTACEMEWEKSPEYREMVTARRRYIDKKNPVVKTGSNGKCVKCDKLTSGRFCKDCI